MNSKEKIDKKRLPRHIAIIMDGNGRWARQKGNARIFGHRNGIKAVRNTVEGAAEIGVEYLTLYAFSTENWKRPKKEIDALMSLLVSAINTETKALIDNNIRLQAIGDLDKLPRKVYNELVEAIDKTSKSTGLTLILALSYSAKWEIVQAVKKIIAKFEKGQIEKDDITQQLFQKHLLTQNFPDPELLIRTSGEYRISNFLLWQIAYAELYFTETLWPDFRKKDLFKAILDFQKREKKNKKISEQVKNNQDEE